MVKISKNPGQCAGKKLFFFFYTKNGQNPGQCESRTLWNTVLKNLTSPFLSSKYMFKKLMIQSIGNWN